MAIQWKSMGLIAKIKSRKLSLGFFSYLGIFLLSACGGALSPLGSNVGGNPLADPQAASVQGATKTDQNNSNNDTNTDAAAVAEARVVSGGGDDAPGTVRAASAPLSAGAPIPTSGFLGDDAGTPGYLFKVDQETITPLTGKAQGMIKVDATGQVTHEKGDTMQPCCENQFMLFEVRDSVNGDLQMTCVYTKLKEDGGFNLSYTGSRSVNLWAVAYLFNAGENVAASPQGPCPSPQDLLPGITIAANFFGRPQIINLLPDISGSTKSLPLQKPDLSN